MLKRVSSDLGVHDDGLRKLVSKIDVNGDGMIQFSAAWKPTAGSDRADEPSRWNRGRFDSFRETE